MNTKMQTKKAKRGFTITELVIVIAVIAILAAVLIPTFSNVINRANESAAMQEAKSEFDNFSPEMILTEEEDVDDDFIFAYKDKTTDAKYFAVVNGQFYPDFVGEGTTVPASFQLDGYNCTTTATLVGITKTQAEGSVEDLTNLMKDYVIQNDNITIYVLTVVDADAPVGG